MVMTSCLGRTGIVEPNAMRRVVSQFSSTRWFASHASRGWPFSWPSVSSTGAMPTATRATMTPDKVGTLTNTSTASP